MPFPSGRCGAIAPPEPSSLASPPRQSGVAAQPFAQPRAAGSARLLWLLLVALLAWVGAARVTAGEPGTRPGAVAASLPADRHAAMQERPLDAWSAAGRSDLSAQGDAPDAVALEPLPPFEPGEWRHCSPVAPSAAPPPDKRARKPPARAPPCPV